MMSVRVNGELLEIKRAGNVRELVEELQLAPNTLLIEHNGLALRREEWDGRILNEDDGIEIIRIVAGG